MATHGTLMMFNAGKNLNDQKGRVDESSGKGKKEEPKQLNQLNKDIATGNAPKGITRFDKGKTKGEQNHVHFKDGKALNQDGTWKHGEGEITNKQTQYLKKEWLENTKKINLIIFSF